MEETANINAIPSETPFLHCNFIGGLWHGAFLALGMSLTQPTMVISAFVADLTGSTIWISGLATILTVTDALPQLFVARWMQARLNFIARLTALTRRLHLSGLWMDWSLFAKSIKESYGLR